MQIRQPSIELYCSPERTNDNLRMRTKKNKQENDSKESHGIKYFETAGPNKQFFKLLNPFTNPNIDLEVNGASRSEHDQSSLDIPMRKKI